MRFLMHGAVHPDVEKALVRHEHVCHALLELTAVSDAPVELADRPGLLLPVLEKKQWNLVTVDSAFVQTIYEEKIAFNGVVVLILDNPGDLHDQGKAIDRLFERYKRLTPRRLYTITPSRVKIRQLPGSGAV